MLWNQTQSMLWRVFHDMIRTFFVAFLLDSCQYVVLMRIVNYFVLEWCVLAWTIVRTISQSCTMASCISCFVFLIKRLALIYVECCIRIFVCFIRVFSNVLLQCTVYWQTLPWGLERCTCIHSSRAHSIIHTFNRQLLQPQASYDLCPSMHSHRPTGYFCLYHRLY